MNIVADNVKINLDYKPFPAQQQIHDCKTRYRVINHGTRFGGTRCALLDGLNDFVKCLNETRENMIPSVYWLIVCPSAGTTTQTWCELKHYFPLELVTDISNDAKAISTINGGYIEVIDISVTDSNVGVGLDVATVVDAGRIPDLLSVWANVEARLNSPGRGLNGLGGRAIIESSTRDMRDKDGNVIKDFRTIYSWGEKSSPNYDPDWQSFTFSSWDNPLMAAKGEERKSYAGEDEDGESIFVHNPKAPNYKSKLRIRLGDKRYARDFLAQFIDEDEPQERPVFMDFAPKMARFATAMKEFESAYEDLFGKGATARVSRER